MSTVGSMVVVQDYKLSPVRERIDDYDYEYPQEAVAQTPPSRREDARLLRVRRFDGVEAEGHIPDLLEALRPGDLMVINDVRVMPARLTAVREATGGRVSLLVLSAVGRRATVLMGARGTLLAGERLIVDGDVWSLVEVGGEGRAVLEVVTGRDVDRLLSEAGRMPLPPYLGRDPVRDERDDLDRERYQTTFAHPVDGPLTDHAAVAAPTAGLHLTSELLAAVSERGVELGRVRLEVGEGTFRPIRVDDLADHRMHAETYSVSEELAGQIEAARSRDGRVVAVGTTTVRALGKKRCSRSSSTGR